jgi:hypothetical protein
MIFQRKCANIHLRPSAEYKHPKTPRGKRSAKQQILTNPAEKIFKIAIIFSNKCEAHLEVEN